MKSELFVAMNSRGRLYGTVGMHSILFVVRQCWLNGSPGNGTHFAAAPSLIFLGMGPPARGGGAGEAGCSLRAAKSIYLNFIRNL